MSKKSQRERWTVVVAEDDDDAALLIQIALDKVSTIPVEMHRASNGHEAMVLVEDVFPDLILLDLQMPGLTGHEILEKLKGDDEYRRIPVAVLTGSDDVEDIGRTYGLGSNHFIKKPDDPAELEESLRSLMNNLEDLARIRRGTEGIEATATSALTASSVMNRKLMLWSSFAAAVVFLVVFAIVTGVFER